MILFKNQLVFLKQTSLQHDLLMEHKKASDEMLCNMNGIK